MKPYTSPLVKTLLAATLLSPLLPSTTHPSVHAAQTVQQEISVLIDGEKQSYDQAPILRNDRVLVPMRGIFEKLGAVVTWDAGTQTVHASKGSVKLQLKLRESTLFLGSQSYVLDQPPVIVKDRVMVPVRVISETFGALVKWDGAKQEVAISTDTMKLFELVDSQNLDELDRLLKEGYDPETRAFFQRSPLNYAFDFNKPDAAKVLLENGADRNHAVFQQLIEREDVEAVKLYVRHYVPQRNEPIGEWALALAAAQGKSKLVQALLEAGIDANTPAWLAYQQKDLLLKTIVFSPLYEAVKNNELETVKVLLAGGADTNLPLEHDHKSSVLFLPAQKNQVPLMIELLAHGALSNFQDEQGWTPLMVAAEQGNTRVVEILLNVAAKPNLKNQHGATAVQIAKAHGHQETVKVLLATGATDAEPIADARAVTRNYAK